MESYLDEKYFINRKNATQHFRQNIFTSWNYRCAYCGSPANTLDHIHPKSKGGLNRTDNLVACCSNCNLSKGSEDLEDWFPSQYFWTLERHQKILYWMSRILEGSACSTS